MKKLGKQAQMRKLLNEALVQFMKQSGSKKVRFADFKNWLHKLNRSAEVHEFYNNNIAGSWLITDFSDRLMNWIVSMGSVEVSKEGRYLMLSING